MSTLVFEIKNLTVTEVRMSAHSLNVQLCDGRTLGVPIAWFPRLQAGTPAERRNLRLIGDGEGIHWPDLDEDISIECLLAGKGSMESTSSFAEWLKKRTARKAHLRKKNTSR